MELLAKHNTSRCKHGSAVIEQSGLKTFAFSKAGVKVNPIVHKNLTTSWAQETDNLNIPAIQFLSEL